MDFKRVYKPEDRGTLLDILEQAGRTSRTLILDIKEARKGEQIGGTGHQTGTQLYSSAPGLVLSAIRQHAIDSYDIDLVEIVFESSNFEYDFRSGKPVLVVDEIDGQKFTGRFQSQRATLETRLQRQGWEVFNMKPDSAVCMALFEGPTFKDIVVNVTTTMQGDVFSAIKESEERSVAYINDTRIVSTDLQPPDLRLEDCQIDIMGNTNFNVSGIGALADQLIRTKKYGEVRIASSGSSAIDIVNMIAGKMDAIVDLRALYDESWASLEIADIASMYRFLKAVDFYTSDVKGNSLDSYMTDENILRNQRITLIVARTRELGESIVKDLSQHLNASVDDWEKRRYLMEMPVNPEYKVVIPKGHSPFKASYIGEHIRSGQRKFVHIIELNDDGREFLEQEGISFEEYLKKECRIALLAESGHENIIEMETPITLADGKISLVEPVCDRTLADVYQFGEKHEPNEVFYEHMSQFWNGLAFCHTYSDRAIIHGDLKKDNIGIIGNLIKLDDFGVSSLVREVNDPTLRGKPIGAIDTRAPELFKPDSKKDTRSDNYSGGAIMCSMLTGYYPNPLPYMKKPKKTDSKRLKYEEQIEIFRTGSQDYQKELETRIADIPEDLRVFMLRLLHRDPNRRPENAAVAKEEFGVVKKRFEIYRTLTQRINDEIRETPPEEYLYPHLSDTEKKLLRSNHGISYAERLAAVLHDYEMASGRKVKQRANEQYSSYKRRHATVCAKIAGQMLQEEGADAQFISDISTLIKYHDHVGLPKSNHNLHRKIERIKDADSLSFFDVNLDTYFEQHKGNEDRLRTKIRFMYNKMSDNAKKLLASSPKFQKIHQYLMN